MKFLKYLLILVIFLPLLLLRDYTPNNELRYLSIIDEALRNGNFFTFTNHGEIYADKPPLYFWLLMLSRWLFGGHCILVGELFSFIPALFIIYIMNKWTSEYLDKELKAISLIMTMTTALFIGAAIILRMDMLMCLFIVLSLYTFYKLYSGKSKLRDSFLLPFYIFMAIFSKGPIGLLLPFLSIIAFLVIKKEIKYFSRYFGWKQWLILIGLSVLWFTGVFLEGGKEYLNNLLFHQTVNRAVDSFHHKEPFYYYLKTIWYGMAPWVLFYVTTIILGITKKVMTTNLEKFFLTIITVTLVMLSIFSSKIEIYFLPAYPFIIFLSLLFLSKLKECNLYFTIAIPAFVVLFAFPFVVFFNYIMPKSDITVPFIGYVAAFILTISAFLSIYFLYKKDLIPAIKSLGVGILLTIFTGSFALPSYNQYIGFREMAFKAQSIAHEENIENYYFYRFRSGDNMEVYINQKIVKIELNDIPALTQKQDFILFVRNRDILRENELEEIIENRPKYAIGEFQIVTFKK